MAKIQSLRGVAGKETIYVDVDDEITSIIDKIQTSKGKVIALVLPKRAPVLQSIVNMKLLKRTAENADKNLALITSEAGLLPLAGAVGLHVASSPTSKPSVPAAPVDPGDEPEDVDEPLNITDGNADGTDGDTGAEEFDPSAAADKTVGELAATGGGKISADGIDESIDMTDDPGEEIGDKPIIALPKLKKNSKLRVPNFDSFRKKIALGVVGLIALVVAWIYAFIVLPSAAITIKTDSSTIKTNLNLVLDASAKTVDATTNVVPATTQSQEKTASQQAAATGQQNNGAKATGTVTIVNCTTDNSEVTISAGRSLTSGGHTYTLNNSIDLQDSAYTGGACSKPHNSHNTTTVGVTALKGGADYNADSGTSFTVSTSSSDGFSASEVKITGSTSGGTDEITKIVLQGDIDSATAKIAAADSSSIKQQLTSNLQSKGLLPVPSTFVAGDPKTTSSAKAGDAADSVTVTAVTAYTMLGVQKADLQKLVTDNVNGQIDKVRQVILDDGVANATFTQANPATATGANVAMEAKSIAGPQLDAAKLKTQLAGKKVGDVKAFIKKTPGVTDVDVKLSPFWVSIVPKNAEKVTIHIVKADD